MLRTERLILQPWTQADLGDALRLWTDADVMELLGGPLSHAGVVARLEQQIANQQRYGFQYWRATHESRFVGCCGLKPAIQDPSLIELGFHFLREAWHQGFASEGARAAVEHGFTVGDAVHAGHHPKNQASRNVLRKLGFGQIDEVFYAPTGLMHPWYRLSKPQ